MTSSKRPDPLEPVLRESEAELKRLLRETCIAEANGVIDESSAEIRRLEDMLLAAAAAAEQTISLRRHIRENSARGGTALPAEADTTRHDAGSADAAAVERVREFRDAQGQMWRAWSVIPGRARTDSPASRYLGEFHKGWICFEALDSTSRRRFPCEQGIWSDLTDQDLEGLLGQAVTAPPRKSGSAGVATPKSPEKTS